jgi:hypothetical protein
MNTILEQYTAIASVNTPIGREQFVKDIVSWIEIEWESRDGREVLTDSRATKSLKQALHRWVEEAAL